MNANVCRIVTCLHGLPTTELKDSLATEICLNTWYTKRFITPIPQCLRPPNLKCAVLPWGAQNHITRWVQRLTSHVTNEKHYNFTNRVPWLPPLKSRNISMMYFFKITRQTVTFISPVPQWLWPLNLIEWWLTLSSSTYLTLWSSYFAGSCDKLKPLYLQYYSFYDQQTWQEDDLLWVFPIIIVTWSFDYVVLFDCVTK